MRRLLLGVMLAGLLTAGCSAESTDNGGVSQGLGSKDATKDVVQPIDCTADEFGLVEGTIEVVNNSEEASDYYIELTILDSDEANVGTANALIQRVEPGQKGKTDLVGTFSGEGPVTCKLTEVQRTASA